MSDASLFQLDKEYDVIVCGAGHAGCEAALALPVVVLAPYS